jgi:hypothetical protein
MVILTLVLSACVPTSTSSVLDAAQLVVTQLPNSSGPESATTWIRDFENRSQTGTAAGNILAPTWHGGPWPAWGPSSVAYSVGSARSKVVLDIALLAVGPDEAGLTGKPDSSYMCVHVVLDPGKHADMTNVPCPLDVQARASATAQYSTMVSLDGNLHADANGR